MTNLNEKFNEIKENPLGTLLKFRNYIIILCKLISIVLFSYYIVRVQEYEVTWTLFASFFPGIVGSINDFLNFFGTMILLVPLSLIITSFFHENRILQLFAVWFSFAGSIFAVFFGIFNRSLLENINLKFFRITHLMNLQDKQNIIINKYQSTANLLGNNIQAKTDYILKQLSSGNQKVIDNELVNFKTIQEIDDYTFALCSKLSAHYDQIQEQLRVATKQHAWSIFDYVSPGTLIIGATITVLIIGTIYYFGSSNADNLKGLAEVQQPINHTVAALHQNGEAALDNLTKTITASAQAMNALTTSVTAQTALHDSAYGGLLELMNTQYMKVCHTLIEVFESNNPENALAVSKKLKEIITTPLNT